MSVYPKYSFIFFRKETPDRHHDFTFKLRLLMVTAESIEAPANLLIALEAQEQFGHEIFNHPHDSGSRHSRGNFV